MNSVRKKSFTRSFLATAGTIVIAVGVAQAASEPASTGGAPVIRRLSPDQYKQTLLNIFGQDIKLAARFEPDLREGGMFADGAGRVSDTTTGLEP